VFNILPQGEQGNIYNVPYYASRDKRTAIAAKMNKMLKFYSEKEKYKFIDINNKLIDSTGRRKKEYIFDDVHFNRKIMKFVSEELK
jgi:lysophospholipase L1-like esterase